MSYIEDDEEPLTGRDHDGDDSDNTPLAYCFVGCGCCLCLSIIALCYGLSLGFPSCGDTAPGNYMHWNAIIPPTTGSQLEPWTFLHQEVSVYSNNTKIGYWSRHKAFWSPASYVYVSVVAGQETILLQGSQPTGWFRIFQAKGWTIGQCDESLESYKIQEDWWSRSWFEWGQKTRNFDIFNKAGLQIARSEHTLSEVFSLGGWHWEVIIKSQTGEVIAELVQETYSDSAWFQKQSYTGENLRPDIIPSELVSFLTAVFDLDLADKDDDE